MKLYISSDLSLPLDAATQTFAFIARKGAGKTYAAGKLAECLLDARVQVVVLDSVGNWWGLRLDADGKTAGYDIPVVGGLRGDIPLEATGGQLIANILTDSGRSMILDVSQFSKADRQRFATAFAEELWKRKKAERHPSPIHLIIEESQLIVPENVRGDAAKMVGIYEEIIRLGRNYGIGISMISQRPQSVNKEVLNQTECLFVLQVNGAHERKALKEWIVYHGVDRSLIDELPSLSIGTAYVWSPQWLQILRKVRIAKKKTFDASATPKVGSHQVRRDLKALDLDDLKERMAATIERAKADDPKELRREIATLKNQITKFTKPVQIVSKRSVESVEKRVVVSKDLARLEKLPSVYESLFAKIAAVDLEAKTRIESLLNLVRQALPARGPLQRAVITPRPAPIVKFQKQEVQANGNAPKITGGALRMLRTLAIKPEQRLTKSQLGTLAKMKSTSGTFGTYMSRLRHGGFIAEEGDYIQITQNGIDFIGIDIPPSPQTSDEILAQWLAAPAVRGASKEMLKQLFAAYPNGYNKYELGELTNMTPSSGTFGTYLSVLRSNGLIQERNGIIYASDSMFINE